MKERIELKLRMEKRAEETRNKYEKVEREEEINEGGGWCKVH